MTGFPEHIHAIDIHNHVWPGPDGRLDRVRAQALLDGAGILNIESICVSTPLMSDAPSPDEVRRTNDFVFEAMAMDKRFLGFCFVNPGHADDAVTEIRRCVVDGGMRGVKLYHQYLVCDPAQRPVMECAAGLGIPVLMHAGKFISMAHQLTQPRLSHAGHFIRAVKMFPGTKLIQGHIGGGGDWEWNLRQLECRPGTYIDISGSVVDAGIVRRTVDALGADHVLFATDGFLEEGVGKLLDAGLSEDELELICRRNAEKLLQMEGGHHV